MYKNLYIELHIHTYIVYKEEKVVYAIKKNNAINIFCFTIEMLQEGFCCHFKFEMNESGSGYLLFSRKS